MKVYPIWHVLGDETIIISVGRSELESVADELRGIDPYPGWASYFAGKIDEVLAKVAADEEESA